MVELSPAVDVRELLAVLDDRPQTPQRLAKELERDVEDVEKALAEAKDRSLAIDWGDVWATSWRAKLKLAPGFFEVSIPASTALGAGIAGLGVYLNGPDGAATLGAALLAVALVSGLAAGIAARQR